MEGESLVLYDGYCNLCSWTVQWIIRNDPGKRFTFRPLRGGPSASASQKETASLEIDPHEGDTVLLLVNGKIYHRSGAALRIATRLRFPWPLLGIFLLVPPFIRNGIYNLVARNRKRWFGTRTTCYLS